MMPLARVVACACVPAAFNHRPRRWLLLPWRAMAAMAGAAMAAPWRAPPLQAALSAGDSHYRHRVVWLLRFAVRLVRGAFPWAARVA